MSTWIDRNDIHKLLMRSKRASRGELANIHERIRARERIFGTDLHVFEMKCGLALYYKDYVEDWPLSVDILRQVIYAQRGEQSLKNHPIFYDVVCIYGLCLGLLGRQRELGELKHKFPNIDWIYTEEKVQKTLARKEHQTRSRV